MSKMAQLYADQQAERDFEYEIAEAEFFARREAEIDTELEFESRPEETLTPMEKFELAMSNLESAHAIATELGAACGRIVPPLVAEVDHLKARWQSARDAIDAMYAEFGFLSAADRPEYMVAIRVEREAFAAWRKAKGEQS